MEGDSFASGVQTAAILESVEKLIGEKKYREAEEGAIALLPEVPFTAYDVRLRIHSLLHKSPHYFPCEPEREDAQRVATAMIGDRQSPSVAQLQAHLLHYQSKPLGAKLDELSGLRALECAKKELQNGTGGKEAEILAHTLMCCCHSIDGGQDVRTIGEHLSALMLLGDEHALAYAVCGVGSVFHHETNFQYFGRALECIGDPLLRSRILTAKMGTLTFCLMDCGDDADKQEKWMTEYETAFTEAYVQLQLGETSMDQRARAQLFLSVYAILRDDTVDIVELHLEASRRIAEELNRPDLWALCASLDAYIDELEKERAGKEKGGENDDDDDDDQWWRKGPKGSAD